MKVEPPPALASAEAIPPTARSGLEALRTHHYRLIWTEIGTQDEPMWWLDAYDEQTGKWRGGGLGNNRDDAIFGDR